MSKQKTLNKINHLIDTMIINNTDKTNPTEYKRLTKLHKILINK